MRPEKELILELMQKERITKAELARRLEKKNRATVYAVLSSEHSMLVSDFIKYADALGYEIEITANKKQTEPTQITKTF